MSDTAPDLTPRSTQLFDAAKRHIPGGVNSPVRAFKAVGGTPRFFDRASGAYMFDADGRRYIDYVLSWAGSTYNRSGDCYMSQLVWYISCCVPTNFSLCPNCINL